MKHLLLEVLLLSGSAMAETILPNPEAGEVRGIYSVKDVPTPNNWIGLATTQTITFRISDKEVLSFGVDGVTKWNGRVVESDDEFKAAMIDLVKSLSGRCAR
jgi:hypothetical protein